MTNQNMYAIVISGYGKKRQYILRKVVDETYQIPVDCRGYRTVEAANKAAEKLGITISAIGDHWKVISAYSEWKRQNTPHC